jgi:GT2 family glycosyltransferase
MITTHNRLSDLRQTLEVLERINPPPLEILVTADGCADGTVEFVRQKFPGVKLIVNPKGLGSVASRDRMMREAAGDLVVSFDDDSYPEQTDCVTQLVELFAGRPRLAVAHFPQRTDEYPETLARTDFGAPCPTRTFANSGACLRRSTYLQLPGFEPRFFHAYEEPDYGLQCFASGYEIYYTPIITVRHHYSSQARNKIRTHHRHARNELWSTLMRCPFPYAEVLVGYRILSQFRFACRKGVSWVIQEPVWWWQALKGIPYFLRKAKPYSWASYRQWLSLPVKL